MRKELWVACSASALAMGATMADSAIAQEASGATGAERFGDGEIIVTAQRREERLEDVPMSITALTGDELFKNGAVSTQDLTTTVPGLVWGRSTNFSQPTIRGVGSRNAAAGNEPNVATFLDGVYQPSQSGTLQELANLERIEVLKGPQGTLFGRNATGGAINIVTKKPSFTMEGNISAEYGSFDYYKMSGYITGPVVDDVVALSVAALRYGDDGYITNVVTGKKVGESDGTAIRAKLLIEPSSAVSLSINGLYSSTDNALMLQGVNVNGNTLARAYVDNPLVNTQNYPLDIVIPDGPYETSLAEGVFANVKQYLLDGHFSADLGFATLSGLASIGRVRIHSLSPTEESVLNISNVSLNNFNNYSNQELVLTSNSTGRLTWLIGAMGFQADAAYNPLYVEFTLPSGGIFVTNRDYGQNTKAWAAYAEATYEVVDNLFLTGGVRYSWDRKKAFVTNNLTGETLRDRKSWSDVTTRAVVRWEFQPNASVYASFTQGFKAGTFNPVSPDGIAGGPADPENINAYEVGFKGRLLDWLSVDAAAFYYDYTDLQVDITEFINGGVSQRVENAATAKIKGIELVIDAQITQQLSLNAALSLLDPEFDSFPLATVVVPTVDALGVPTLTGNSSIQQDVSGFDLIRAPRRTLNLGANYTTPLGEGTLDVSANAFFSSKYWDTVDNRIGQPAYEVVNASITYTFPGDLVSLTLYGRNLTDQVYQLGTLPSSLGDKRTNAKPRVWGVRGRLEF